MERDENVATVRRMWDAYREEGLRGILAFAAPDAEWRPYSAHGRVFHGNDEYAAYIDEMERNLEVVEAQLVDMHAQADCVVVSGRLRIRGPDGLEDNPMHWVHRFRDGQIVLTTSYPNLDTALEAAGLDVGHRIEARWRKNADMGEVEYLLVGLLVAIIVLSTVARWMSIPYPIVLVLGGLVLGFVPGMPKVELNPDLVLLLFLPPLLYSAAFFADLRALRSDARPILVSAIGLVLFTMCAVAFVVHELVDGMPWAAAFALGAVVSPTDPLAATQIMRRFDVPRRMVNVVEGESLVNDATALVAYKLAVGAAIGETFSLWEAGFRFVAGAAGGIAIGLVAGFVIAEIRRRLDDPPVEVTVSLVSAYAAYIPAERAGCSAVLAAVTCGLYLGWKAPHIASPRARIQALAVWESLIFILNALLFVLIGLQLRNILDGLSGYSTATLAGYAAAVSAVVILARLVFSFTMVYVIRAIDRRESQRARRAGWRLRLISAWSGMRGSVSLAAALAIPLTAAGEPFPQRDLIIFLTFAVIFATLVLQGLTLPVLIRKLGVRDDGGAEEEELRARLRASKAALARLDELDGEDWTRSDTVERMRGLYNYRLRRFGARAGKVEDDGYEDRSVAYQRTLLEVIDAQRLEILRLRNEGAISSEVMHRIERELDLEASRLEI